MIDLEARAKLAQQRKDEALFAQIGGMISQSMKENNAELKKNFTQGAGNSFELTKHMIKRLDMQILLLLQIHKDLKALGGKKRGL